MDCIFCKISKGEIPSNILYEDEKYLAILDLDQTKEGHSLVIPKKHIEDFTKLSDEELKEMFNIAHNVGSMILEKLHKNGISYNFNYGSLQDIKHVHLHLCPEQKGKNEKTPDEVYSILKGD